MSIALYVHLPFCRVHCTYCPFAISTDLGLEERYVDALLREIDAARGDAADRSVASLYLGGGTPSRTSPRHLSRLLAAIRERFDLAGDAEISMEANPEDVSIESVDRWRALGVNRISVGVQSFDDRELEAIGRIHDGRRALGAARSVVASGARSNLDLILGLPQQTAESFRATLDTAISLGVGHLSLYMLDLEERTPLQVQVARGRVSLPDDGLVADLYLEAVETLGAASLAQYEISNFARPGQACRHNVRYWTREDYLGFGLGAHSLVGARRFARTRDIRRYLESAPQACDFVENLSDNDIRRESIFLALRQTAGMYYEELIRLCPQEGMIWTERGLEAGWLKKKDGRVAFTPAGFLQSTELLAQLF